MHNHNARSGVSNVKHHIQTGCRTCSLSLGLCHPSVDESWQEAPSPEVVQDATHVHCFPVTYPAAHKVDKMTHHGKSGSKQLLECVW